MALSHLGLTGLGGRVTAGHAAGGTRFPFQGKRDAIHSALTHSLHFKLTHGGKSPLSNLRLILAAVGSLVRSAVAAALAGNQTLKFISMHLEAQGVEAFTGLSCRCALGMDLETLSNHYVTVVRTCCIKSNLTLSQ